MNLRFGIFKWRIGPLLILLLFSTALQGGIDKRFQTQYNERYLNKTYFLKVPIGGNRQVVEVRDSGSHLQGLSGGEPLAFKVGEHVRVIGLDFRDRSIRFRVSSLDSGLESSLVFEFEQELESEFPQQNAFEDALKFALTEGISYKDVESAKSSFVGEHYDEIVRQLMSATGTSRQFVVEQLAAQNPNYEKTLSENSQLKSRVSRLEEKLQDAGKASEALQGQVSDLSGQLKQYQDEADGYKEERLRLVDERDDALSDVRRLQREINELKDSQSKYEKQVNQLVGSLQAERGSSEDLNSQVQSLGSFVTELQSERTSLSGRLAAVQADVEELKGQNEELQKSLSAAQSDNRRLNSRLKSLTSDKNGINARYLELRKEKDILETADALSKALQVKAQEVPESEGETRQLTLFLGSNELGTVNLTIPGRSGETARVVMSLVSPDTVKFSDQERDLYSAMGEQVMAQALWESDPQQVEARLSKGELRQPLKVREDTLWEWELEGDPDAPAPLILKLDLINGDGQTVPLYHQAVVISPSGFGRWFAGFILPLVLGFGLGVALLFVFGFRRLPAVRKPRPSHPVDYLREKEL